jgi:hypothetical protein
VDSEQCIRGNWTSNCVFATNQTEANIGYKTLEAMKITTYVNARTTLEAMKRRRKGLCHFFSLISIKMESLWSISITMVVWQKLSNYKTSKIPKLKFIHWLEFWNDILPGIDSWKWFSVMAMKNDGKAALKNGCRNS